jgi:D-beta-D-heptose 7-phosphate kinase / D-beta-D-heptose 1-phosphate adenosyltransferase
MTSVMVIGDAVVDVDVDGEPDRIGPEGCVVLDAHDERRRPGAAALAALFAAADGADVQLVTALGDDEAGAWLRHEMRCSGVSVVDLGLAGPTPQKWRIRTSDGATLLRVDRDCREVAPITDDGHDTWMLDADAILVSDYGRGLAATFASRVVDAARRRPVVWDPHPNGPVPPAGLDLLVPNLMEATRLVGGPPGTDARSTAAELARRTAAAVAVTCGDRGAVLAHHEGPIVEIPARASTGDTCGAGDRFASRAAVQRGAGAGHLAAVSEAVAAAEHFVAHGIPRPILGRDPGLDPIELAAAVRAAGGTVVAAGGCFDLLHAGHVQLLESARALGDCLIICLNSDASIRRLKGNGRPIVAEHDRRRLLEALTCVDGVAVFDEATPEFVLERLQPDVFVKGADYRADELPERDVLERWGGRVAIVPLAGERSTTGLIDMVRAKAS